MYISYLHLLTEDHHLVNSNTIVNEVVFVFFVARSRSSSDNMIVDFLKDLKSYNDMITHRIHVSFIYLCLPTFG